MLLLEKQLLTFLYISTVQYSCLELQLNNAYGWLNQPLCFCSVAYGQGCHVSARAKLEEEITRDYLAPSIHLKVVHSG